MTVEMTVSVSEKDFDEKVLRSELPVLVDFWADWCMPCKMVSPVLDELAGDYAGRFKVCKLNIDESAQIASRYEVMSIPTMAIFKDGKMTDRIVGAVPRDAIEEKMRENL